MNPQLTNDQNLKFDSNSKSSGSSSNSVKEIIVTRNSNCETKTSTKT